MRVTVEGAELFCTAHGRGPACLVLSAIGTRPYERMMPPQLLDHLTLVHVDIRGGGRSTGDPADLTFDVLASDLEAVRAHLGVERLAVLGHSILGILAIEYGRRFPDHVSHVIGVGTPTTGDLARLSAESTSFFERDASAERKQVLRENLAALPPNASAGQALFAQAPMRFFDPRFDAAPWFAESELKLPLLKHLLGSLVSGWDATAAVEPLRVPLYLAHGRYDYTAPYVLWEGIASRLPSATLELYDRSGHHPFLEEPARFTSRLSAWMTGPRAGAG
jgi:proline iminopeptidase